MNRKSILCGIPVAVFFLSFASSGAEAWSIISQEEFENEIAAPSRGQPQLAEQVKGAPAIVVDRPDQTKPITSPVSIQITFEPAADSQIDLSSFQVRYGLLQIDVTSRILEHAKLTMSGLTASDAQLPAGNHRVTIQIGDNRGRVGRRLINFTVK